MLGITLTTRADCCGERLQDVEIRAGKNPIKENFKGRLTANELCQNFAGPGETDREHTITCDKPITAEYVTIQILDDRAILALNEIRLETVSHGKMKKLYFSFIISYTYIKSNKFVDSFITR